ncbi:MAG: hypothetical protein HYS09_07455 [Chloroflexi bacterium]|nr:hypothetical protein [Chloroflexota bacterium]
MTTRRRRFRTIDERVAKEIARLRRRYPDYGRRRLAQLLREKNIEVNESELRRFLRYKAPTGQVMKDRNLFGLPSSVFGGPPEVDP